MLRNSIRQSCLIAFEMADYSEKCADDCSFAYNDDKQRGVCLIKEEFIIEDNVRLAQDESTAENKAESTDDSVSEEPLVKKIKMDDKKEKRRGQNKARPPPYKAQRTLNMCPWISDQAVGEPAKQCDNKRCTFLHDRAEYMKIKPEDIAEDCYVFNITGRCPRGIACRMGSKHLTEDGLNIINEEKYKEYAKKPCSTKNVLSKELQNSLRKHDYDFSKAESVVASNDPSKKKILQSTPVNTKTENNKDPTNGITTKPEVLSEDKVPNVEVKNEEVPCTKSAPSIVNKDEPRIGPVSDEDQIKLRPCEKKRIEWKDKILLSSLTTVGNLPFRRICKEFGADITCGEMALAPKILKGAPEEWALVKRHESEDIFGIQLCGNNPGVLTRCAQLLSHELNVDYIDLNLGCPIDLIYRQGGGSGMLNRLNVLETVVKSVSQVLNIPLTIKSRMGVYIDKPIAHNLMPKFRDWGASMITLHGRSREQRYTKLADWEYIEKCAQAAKPVALYGNGDVLSFDDFQRVRETYTTVQGVTIGRGALIKPWIFTEIKEKRLIDISSSERFDILRKYTNYGLEHWGSDTRGVETTRRFMLEWISFLHRYVPVGILEKPPQRINERPPYYRGRNDLETLMASSNCEDWVRISEMLLGKVPEGFRFLPKHKANSWK